MEGGYEVKEFAVLLVHRTPCWTPLAPRAKYKPRISNFNRPAEGPDRS